MEGLPLFPQLLQCAALTWINVAQVLHLLDILWKLWDAAADAALLLMLQDSTVIKLS